MKMHIKSIVIAVAITIMPGFGAVQAEPVSKPVSYAGLDLGSDAGRATLDRRITSAAFQICGDYDLRDVEARLQERHCRANAIGPARTRANVVIAQFEQQNVVQLASNH